MSEQARVREVGKEGEKFGFVHLKEERKEEMKALKKEAREEGKVDE